jgi:hypothetical protein
MTEHPKALRAFYGASDRLKANTVKSQIGAGSDRPQEVYTPQCIVDALAVLWPDGVQLDPCAGPESLIGAHVNISGQQVPVLDRNGQPRKKKNGDPILKWVGEGLTTRWVPRTYFNPPYVDLQEWLEYCLTDAIVDCDGGLVGLMPARTHRKWFREYWECCTRFCALNPVQFVGYDQTFPDRLFLTYHGDQIERFDLACQGLGKCYSLA